MSGEFVPTVKRVLSKHEVEPGAIELELSERGVLSGNHDVVEQLQELKALGIRLSIDDFGTGYSSLSYLKQLPITKLKIDRSFVAHIAHDTEDVAIIRAIMALADNLGLEIIAEGIENKRQEAFLKTQHCQYGQGFYYSHPLPAAQVEKYLKQNKS